MVMVKTIRKLEFITCVSATMLKKAIQIFFKNPHFIVSIELHSKLYRHFEGKIPVYLNLYHAVIYVSMVIHGLHKYTVISIQQCTI